MKINNFLERFNFFYDSIIRDVEIRFRNSSFPAKIKVIISTRDKETKKNEGWVDVKIEITEAVEFNFRESSKESYQVISNGLHIMESDALVYFDFGFHTDVSESPKEFRKSNFYIIGKSFDWAVEDYKNF